MADLLSAAVVVLALAAALAAALLGLVVRPFIAACDAAEARGGTAVRAGALVLAATALAAAAALLAVRAGVPLVAAVLPLGLPWLAVVAVHRVPPLLLGRRGRYEAGVPDDARRSG